MSAIVVVLGVVAVLFIVFGISSCSSCTQSETGQSKKNEAAMVRTSNPFDDDSGVADAEDASKSSNRNESSEAVESGKSSKALHQEKNSADSQASDRAVASRQPYSVDAIQLMKPHHKKYIQEGTKISFDAEDEKRTRILGQSKERTIANTDFSNPRPPLHHAIVTLDSPIQTSSGVDGLVGVLKDSHGNIVKDSFNTPIRVIVYASVLYSTTHLSSRRAQLISKIRPGNVLDVKAQSMKQRNRNGRFLVVNVNKKAKFISVMGRTKFPDRATGDIQKSIRNKNPVVAKNVEFGQSSSQAASRKHRTKAQRTQGVSTEGESMSMVQSLRSDDAFFSTMRSSGLLTTPDASTHVAAGRENKSMFLMDSIASDVDPRISQLVSQQESTGGTANPFNSVSVSRF